MGKLPGASVDKHPECHPDVSTKPEIFIAAFSFHLIIKEDRKGQNF